MACFWILVMGMIMGLVVRLVVWFVMVVGLMVRLVVVVGLMMRLGVVVRLVFVIILVSGVRHMCHISTVAINVIFYRLDTAIRKEDMVLAGSVLAIPLLIMAKVDLVIVVFDLVTILVIGGVIVVMIMVLLMVLSHGESDGSANQEHHGHHLDLKKKKPWQETI